MKCNECNEPVMESSIVDDIEYFVCVACGNYDEISLKPVKISMDIIYRKGSGNTHESYSSDFSIEGLSLLKIIISKEKTHSDYLGCFARGWDELNEHSKRQLLLLESPEMESGRSLVYVCPECADVGCGAYGCKIKKSGDFYVWESFAYENGYEDPKIIEGLGPYRFHASEYEKVINHAYKL